MPSKYARIQDSMDRHSMSHMGGISFSYAPGLRRAVGSKKCWSRLHCIQNYINM